VQTENTNLESLETDLVIVATDDWPAKIARLVRDLLRRRNLHFGQILFCQGVYEAAATTIELRRRDRAVKACIMVDYLPDREMNVFATLAKLSRVSSIAFSGLSQRKKLIQAQKLGADDLLTASGEVNLKSEMNSESNGIDKPPTNLHPKRPEPKPENSSSQPKSKPSPTAAPDDNEPLLSRDEIDALLN
jgi:hypothetical protein